MWVIYSPIRIAGPLCLGKHIETRDRRLDDIFPTFKKFNRTLRWHCDSGDPAILEITPNSSWPDTVYYNSFTHANMGWKIHIVDSYSKNGAIDRSLSLSIAFAIVVVSFIVWILISFKRAILCDFFIFKINAKT